MTQLAKTYDSSAIDRSGASTDAQLVDLWLRRQSARTRAEYQRAYEQFRACVGDVALRTLTVWELQDFCEGLSQKGYAVATQAQRISAIKSLLSFAQTTGYCTFNVGAAIKTPKIPFALAQRIISEEEVVRLISAARPGRDRTLIRLLYVSGARLDEVHKLNWEHVIERDAGSIQITLHGKGDKVRNVLLTPTVSRELLMLRIGAAPEAPVFLSRRQKRLAKRDIQLIVDRVARAAQLSRKPSPHWLRHAHASHAMDRGAPLHLVQDTLGHASAATTGRYLHARPGESSGKYLGV